jgi:hypothetical protein
MIPILSIPGGLLILVSSAAAASVAAAVGAAAGCYNARSNVMVIKSPSRHIPGIVSKFIAILVLAYCVIVCVVLAWRAMSFQLIHPDPYHQVTSCWMVVSHVPPWLVPTSLLLYVKKIMPKMMSLLLYVCS